VSPGATFERVYRALKEQLGSGRYRPGEPLEPRALSDALSSSITPVRDALHRLVGEGLVEAPRGSGFRTPLVTEVALRDLYAWNEALLMLGTAALPVADRRRVVADRVQGGAVRQWEALFESIAARTGNPEHVEAIAHLNDRLRPIRAVEAMVLGADDDEFLQLENTCGQGDRQALRRGIRAYHRRRERAAPLLVAALVGR
jgi:DNA-binding GntR family transcriptional regulator